MAPPGLLQAVAKQLQSSDISLEAWALAWARISPTLVLVPAFGARLLPPVGKAVLGLSLGFIIAPALAPTVEVETHWAWQLLLEVGRGLPVALSTSALLWAASMAGGLADDVRGGGQNVRVGILEPDTPALGALFGLFAAIAFLKLGGVSRLIRALAAPNLEVRSALVSAVGRLVDALYLAVALAAPLLSAVVLWEIAAALIAKAATPAHIQMTLSPARALVVLLSAAVALDAIFELMVRLLSA